MEQKRQIQSIDSDIEVRIVIKDSKNGVLDSKFLYSEFKFMTEDDSETIFSAVSNPQKLGVILNYMYQGKIWEVKQIFYLESLDGTPMEHKVENIRSLVIHREGEPTPTLTLTANELIEPFDEKDFTESNKYREPFKPTTQTYIEQLKSYKYNVKEDVYCCIVVIPANTFKKIGKLMVKVMNGVKRDEPGFLEGTKRAWSNWKDSNIDIVL